MIFARAESLGAVRRDQSHPALAALFTRPQKCETCGRAIEDADPIVLVEATDWRCDCIPGGPQCCSDRREVRTGFLETRCDACGGKG